MEEYRERQELRILCKFQIKLSDSPLHAAAHVTTHRSIRPQRPSSSTLTWTIAKNIMESCFDAILSPILQCALSIIMSFMLWLFDSA